jgi:hypothetical protein
LCIRFRDRVVSVLFKRVTSATKRSNPDTAKLIYETLQEGGLQAPPQEEEAEAADDDCTLTPPSSSFTTCWSCYFSLSSFSEGTFLYYAA